MSSSSENAGIIPAALSFLAIYNPTLSDSDESFKDQIVYYYSKSANGRNRVRHESIGAEYKESKEEENERLRQVGLAQGIVGFANNFTDGKPVDSIETEKSRVVLHELEQDWWLLASIDLTRLSSSARVDTQSPPEEPLPEIEYSAREVSPPALLLQQLKRAHKIFLLHQSPSLADLWARTPRTKFCGFLKRFWDEFIWSWDVMLHGNPAIEIFNGLKLAAGGELGVGVGEEEWGSGEREILEGFVERTEGLVDLVVSRFGDTPENNAGRSTSNLSKSQRKNVGFNSPLSGRYPRPSDGIVFSGVGAVTRSSVKDLSSWTEWLYTHGSDVYGVRDNPSAAPRRKRRKIQASDAGEDPTNHAQDIADKSAQSPKIPPPILSPERIRSTRDIKSRHDDSLRANIEGGTSATIDEGSFPGPEVYMKYLTLGVYGSSWGIPSGRPVASRRDSDSHVGGRSHASQTYDPKKPKTRDPDSIPHGYFLIGLQGDLEEDIQVPDDEEGIELETDRENGHENEKSSSGRILMRTVHVQRSNSRPAPPEKHRDKEDDPIAQSYPDRLRVVVYIQKPFIFTFVFELQTDALAIPSFYRSLDHQLGPLQRPLLASTSPSKVSERLWEAASPKSTASTKSSQPIKDLVYDPGRLTVHSSVPNIPEPGSDHTEQSTSEYPWSRVEALSVHSQILNTYTSTRRQTSQLETTAKTSRGFWVVWMRLLHDNVNDNANMHSFREAFLIRKASDYVSPATRKSSGRFGRDVSGSAAGGGWGPGKLAEGIGIDARQYIDSLLSLNR